MKWEGEIGNHREETLTLRAAQSSQWQEAGGAGTRADDRSGAASWSVEAGRMSGIDQMWLQAVLADSGEKVTDSCCYNSVAATLVTAHSSRTVRPYYDVSCQSRTPPHRAASSRTYIETQTLTTH